MLAFVELDLDSERNFAQRLILLTNCRLVECGVSASGVVESPKFWDLSPDLQLHASVQSGLGKLELLSGEKALHQWPFTSACETIADRFVAAHASRVRNRTLAASDGAEVGRCASCGARYR